VTLITEEAYLEGTTPVQIVASSLLGTRMVTIFWSEYSVKIGSANDNEHGCRLVQTGDSGPVSFPLAAGAALWAWSMSSLSPGYISYMVNTTIV